MGLVYLDLEIILPFVFVLGVVFSSSFVFPRFSSPFPYIFFPLHMRKISWGMRCRTKTCTGPNRLTDKLIAWPASH